MLLLILWAIVGTLAMAQGLIVLFLIRTRGNNLALADEILRLQRSVATVDELKRTLALTQRRLAEVERLILDEEEEEDAPPVVETGRVIRLAAVGGMAR